MAQILNPQAVNRSSDQEFDGNDEARSAHLNPAQLLWPPPRGIGASPASREVRVGVRGVSAWRPAGRLLAAEYLGCQMGLGCATHTGAADR